MSERRSLIRDYPTTRDVSVDEELQPRRDSRGGGPTCPLEDLQAMRRDIAADMDARVARAERRAGR